MIVAGEASGDLHGGNLVREMQRIDPDLSFYGVGGERMKAAGVKLLADAADMAVVGLTEVVFKLGTILQVMHRLKTSLTKEQPDLVILIDYPDFNLPLARTARTARNKSPLLHQPPGMGLAKRADRHDPKIRRPDGRHPPLRGAFLPGSRGRCHLCRTPAAG